MRAVIVAAAVAFLVSLFGTPLAIKIFIRLKAGQPIRADGPQMHMTKQGTPTMGGVVFIVATIIAYVAGHIALTTLPAQQIFQVGPTITALVLLGLMVFCGAVGFIDDFLKVRRRNSGGLNKRGKLLGQLLVGATFGIIALYFPSTMLDPSGSATNTETVGSTAVSFIRELSWLDIGKVGAVILFVFIVLASTNGVNLTDGLDGLATGLAGIAAAAFAVFAYLFGRVDVTTYLNVFYLPGAGELAVFCAALMGATIGFLWFNAHPAEVFMGDTGSLAIGGALGTVAILLKAEFLLLVIGGVFAAEAISVLLQTGTYKWFKRTRGKEYADAHRVFRMAPLHHHFEKLGWAETTVVTRFYILGLLCALVALSTLKVR